MGERWTECVILWRIKSWSWMSYDPGHQISQRRIASNGANEDLLLAVHYILTR